MGSVGTTAVVVSTAASAVLSEPQGKGTYDSTEEMEEKGEEREGNPQGKYSFFAGGSSLVCVGSKWASSSAVA